MEQWANEGLGARKWIMAGVKATKDTNIIRNMGEMGTSMGMGMR